MRQLKNKVASGLNWMALSPSQAAISVVLLRLAGVACQALMIGLLANCLSVVEMGKFSAVYVFWGLVRMLGPMGLDQVALREISFARARGDDELAGGLTRYANLLTGGVNLGVAVLSAAILFVLADWAYIELDPLEVLSIALAVPAFALVSVLSSAVRSYDRNIASQGMESIGLHLLTVVILLLHWWLAQLSLGAVLAWQTVTAWATAGAYAALLHHAVGGRVGPVSSDFARRLWREGLEVFQALVLIGLASRAPTYICMSMFGPAATAILEIAIRFGTLPAIFTTAVSTTFAPTMAARYAKGDRAGLGDTLAVASWLSFVPSAFIMLGAIVLGSWLLGAFLPPIYQLSYVPLLLVVASTTVNGAYGMSSIVLFATGYQQVVRVYSVLQLVTVVVAGYGLGYAFGVSGVAFAILLGFIMFDVGLALEVKPHLGVTGILRSDGLAQLLRSIRGQPLSTSAISS
jgi:O-antigen/teichoic acid export membrane protein